MRFTEIAKREFSFLESAGFSLVECSSTELLYQSEAVSVAVRRDPRDGEVDVYFAPHPNNERTEHSLTALLALEGIARERRPFQVYDESLLGPFLEKLAAETQTVAARLLQGDRMAFRRLAVFGKAELDKYWREMNFRHVRPEADNAWHARAFERFIALYAPFEDYLSEAEKAKLAYARRHVPE